MSDTEGDVVAQPSGGPTDINSALQEVLKTALIHDGISHGLHEATKVLDKRQALLCVLAENCDEPMYKKLVQALCNEHQIPLIRVDNNKKLGEWAGLCKIDNTGKARKVVGCSCVVIKDYGEETAALDMLRDYMKTQGVVS
ncbi:40S ribosomal protein S12 [Homalodisca vitripennis]|uniref:40S ribosomal protein S12 n=2 Tax=Homalodisca liturata TaxID=320908 RepID=A0A1B6JYT5_9HEMI|nr:40S ribosomal protein S12 [Homalodisca vitripennis]